jgi:DNA recombination protein RmuC
MIISVVVVAVFTVLLLHLEQKRRILFRRGQEWQEKATGLEKENALLRQSLENERVQKKAFELQLENQQKLSQTTEDLLERTKKALSEKFEAISHETFFSSQRAFFDMAKQTFEQYKTVIDATAEKSHKEVSGVVEPLRVSLGEMEKKVHELEVTRRGAYDGLNQHLAALSTTQALLHKETNNLVRALREPMVRGRWGEVQLRRVVEVAGMLPYCDFEEQVRVTGEDGILRPDMVIKLPSNRVIVIDAKVSLSACLDAMASENPEEKKEKLVQHAKFVRQHVIRLSQKRYWDQFPQTPDFVVLFLHGECFLAPALEYDPELLEFASSQKVLFATPISLIAMLKVIAFSWGEAQVEKHAQQIIDEAKTWMDRCKIFTEHFSDVGRQLDKTMKAFDKASSSFETRLLVSIRRLATAGLETPEIIAPAPLLSSSPLYKTEDSADVADISSI